MKLVSITLLGFKSFAKKTIINVEHDITGIVGPNGSGKSNVAEAIRFVLGEQSMKSMRGAASPDLIFKGSATLSSLSRAHVSITFDTREKRTISSPIAEDIAPFLAYDEVILSREVFSDGTSDYAINGAKVRLKDVQELLALAGIGASKHTILNQGEADRILLISSYERKELIEDALGLRVYQTRLKESIRKLEKVDAHLAQVELLQKEVTPHLAHLKRQVEKIEKGEAERGKLKTLLHAYIWRESHRLVKEEKALDEVGSSYALSLILESVQKEVALSASREKNSTSGVSQGTLSTELGHKKKSLEEERHKLIEEIGRLEGELHYLEAKHKEDDEEGIYLEKTAIHNHAQALLRHFDQGLIHLDDHRYDDARDEIIAGKNVVTSFQEKYHNENKGSDKEKARIITLKQEIETQRKEEELLKKAILSLEHEIIREKEEEQKSYKKEFEEEKRILLLTSRTTELRGLIALQKEKEDRLASDKTALSLLMEEGRVFVGAIVDSFVHTEIKEHEGLQREELLRAIEKSKIRIEEIGVIAHEEVLKEYTTTKERFAYIENELQDIQKTKGELLHLVEELEVHITTHFKDGVKNLSGLFNDYFVQIFNGGKASLSIVEEKEENTLESLGEEKVTRLGVEIAISLPAKKIKSLALLSGGEKALTSIALLFAMASITPPPFIVLDETDAPLDEHNAKRYGEMLTELSKKSKLLVITHNRETMHYCDMLYGVTLGTDGASRLLSIDLNKG